MSFIAATRSSVTARRKKKVITDFAQRLEQVDWLAIERLFEMKTHNLAAMCHAVGLDPRKDLIGLDLRHIDLDGFDLTGVVLSESDETDSDISEDGLYDDSVGATVRHSILFDLGQVDVRWDEDLAALWSFQIPSERPNLNLSIIRDLKALYPEAQRLREKGNLPFRYLILGSRFPGVFSLGTDLELLADLIEREDAASLNRYAHATIDMFLQLLSSTDGTTITIGLAQGDALGSGFDLLLASDIIVAERSARFGFPEILFGMMSGVVALPLLSRKLGTLRARRLLDEGRIYSAQEMHDMGLVNHLAEDGEGEQTVRDLITRTGSHFSGHAAIYAAERKIDPIEMAELSSMAKIWVQSALKVDARNLRFIRRLASAQARIQK